MSKQFAVIINSFGTYDHVARCLESVLDCSPVDDCDVVWLNASPSAPLRSRYEFMGCPHVPGASLTQAYNLGIAATRAPFVVLLADDVEVVPGWLEKLRAGFEADIHKGVPVEKWQMQGVGMVSPMMEYDCYHRVGVEDHPDWRNAGARLCRPEIFTSNCRPVPLVGSLPVSFACQMFRREVFEQIGGLEEGFPGPSYCFDDDYQARLYTEGWEQVLQTDCVIKHAGMQHTKLRPTEECLLAHWNACQFLKKKWEGRLDWSLYTRPVDQWHKDWEAQQKAASYSEGAPI